MSEGFALATVKAVGPDEGPGQFEAVLSDSTLDRDGEIIGAKAFDPLPASIPIYFEHDWKSGATPIGRGEPFYDGDVVKLKGTFATTARAQEIRSLVVEGVVDSMSVGFLNGRREQKSGTRTVVSGEVFEGSLTAIPINTGAKVLIAKAMNEKAGARNSSTDASQKIHDLAAQNGATCTMSKAVGAETKAIEGSVEALQERVSDALEDAYGEYMCWVRGVLADRVIFNRGSDTFSQSYTDDGAVVTLSGVAVEVDIHEIVVDDADAATEPDEATTLSLSDSNGAVDPAAKAAGSSATDEAAQAKAQIRYRLAASGV